MQTHRWFDRHAPAALVLLGLVLVLSTWVSIDLTRVRGGVSALWLANGMVLGVMLRQPARRWAALLAMAWTAGVATRLYHGDPVAMSLALSIANTLETLLVAWVIRRRVPDIDDPRHLLRLSWLATASTLAASLLSASLATAMLALGGAAGLGTIWLTWFIAHLLGMVMVATLVVVALREGTRLLGREGRRADFIACLLLLAAVCLLVFGQQRYPLLFLAYLPLMLLTYRHGLAGVVMGMLVLAPASGLAALLGTGPFQLVRNANVLEHALIGQVFLGGGVLLALPVGLALTVRRRLELHVRESEARYRLLAEHANDIVARLRRDGTLAYVSPSIRHILGWEPGEFSGAHVHPDDAERRNAMREKLWEHGGESTVAYRALHKDGHYVWLEVVGSRIEGEGGMPEIVYSARDISVRVAAQQAMARSQARLQSLMDSVPAVIMYVGADQRYGFASAAIKGLLGMEPADVVGRTVREVRGEEVYARLQPHVEAALRGRRQSFEGSGMYGGRHYDYQVDYVPDIGPDGAVQGFYALTTDITPLKDAERALQQLAREDALTGLANRRQFEERLEQAVARARRQEQPIALMLLDIDHFKQINDTHGHPAGDAVLRAFADRIRASIYDVDLPVRLGGDEFAVLIEYAAGVGEASVVARRILAAMGEPVVLEDGTGVQAGTSIGIAFQRGATDGDALVALADRALYAAKQAGRNTFRIVRD